MNKIMGWFTRKKLFIISFLLGVLSLFFGYISSNNECFLAYKQCESIAYIFVIFVPLFAIHLKLVLKGRSKFLGISVTLDLALPRLYS